MMLPILLSIGFVLWWTGMEYVAYQEYGEKGVRAVDDVILGLAILLLVGTVVKGILLIRAEILYRKKRKSS